MKKSKKTQSFEKKLKAYSAVATGTLLLAPSAHAAVQYSGPMNLPLNSPGNVLVDLNGDTVNDFGFVGTTIVNPIDRLLLVPYTSAGLGGLSMINTTNSTYLARLPSNYSIRNGINPPYSWTFVFNTLAKYDSVSFTTEGNFTGQRGYIGVSFRSAACPVGGPPHYGWIQFEGNVTATQGTIFDWAYETNCGTAILAGAGAAPAVPAPTLNQWGLLILMTLLAGAGTLMLKKQQENS